MEAKQVKPGLKPKAPGVAKTAGTAKKVPVKSPVNASGKPKIPISAPPPDSKPPSKTEVKPKTPISAPKSDLEPKLETKTGPVPVKKISNDDKIVVKKPLKDAESLTKPQAERGRGRGQGRGTRGIQGNIRGGFNNSGGQRGRGGPGSRGRIGTRGRGKSRRVCQDYIRNFCKFGEGCHFFHPPHEEVFGDDQQQLAWFIFCQDHRMGHCDRMDCRDFHISKYDEDLFRSHGDVAPQMVEEVVQKSMQMDLNFIGTRPFCKNALQNVCNRPNCLLYHGDIREYETEIYYALHDELEYMLGPNDGRQDGMPSGNPGVYEDMPPEEDLRNSLRPHDDFEPQRKRPRYYDDDQGMPPDSMMDRDFHSSFDERRDYNYDNHDRPDPIVESEKMMQEIVILQNDKADIERDGDLKINRLKDRIDQLMHENSRLKSEAIEISNAHQSAMLNLTATNTTLVEDRLKAQDAVRHLERTNSELQRSMNMQMQAFNETNRKFDDAQAIINEERRKLDAAHRELDRVVDRMKKIEHENDRLVSELKTARTKLGGGGGVASGGNYFREKSGDSGWNNSGQGVADRGNHGFQGGMRQGLRGERSQDFNLASGSKSWKPKSELPAEPMHWEKTAREALTLLGDSSQPDLPSYASQSWDSKDREQDYWNKKPSSTWEGDMHTLDTPRQDNLGANGNGGGLMGDRPRHWQDNMGGGGGHGGNQRNQGRVRQFNMGGNNMSGYRGYQ